MGRKALIMSENGAIREFSSHDISTFLHHTEVGEAIKQTTFARETYLGVARIFGLRNKEYLMENLQGLKIGDRVTLYRKYNSEGETCTAVQVSTIPDDGASIRVHTLAGLCLGYVQFPERYVMAELMKAGKHLYAKVRELNVPETKDELDTRNAVSLDIYWVEESTPLKMANTYEVGEPQKKYEAMEQNGGAIWLMNTSPDYNYFNIKDIVSVVNKLTVGDRLKLIRKKTGSGDPWSIEVWTKNKEIFLGHMECWGDEMIANMMDAGKLVYGVVESVKKGLAPHEVGYRFDVYVEDN